LAVVWHAISVARGRLTRILPLASGRGLAPNRAKEHLAKETVPQLLAKVVVQLPASKAVLGLLQLLATGC
jgi:hypothetical protein